MKINIQNASKIQSILALANGRATAHTYSTATEIIALAARAERELLGLLPKKSAPGATYRSESGGTVASAYEYMRATTTVNMVRRGAGWYLASAVASGAWRTTHGSRLTLTAEQDAQAVCRWRTHGVAANTTATA